MALNPFATTHTTGAAVGQYKLVKVSGANVIVTTAATERVFGASQADAADSGEIISITSLGVVKLKASDTIDKGEQLQPAAAGEVAPYAAATGVYICGYALEAAVDGDVFWAVLTPGDFGDPTT